VGHALRPVRPPAAHALHSAGRGTHGDRLCGRPRTHDAHHRPRTHRRAVRRGHPRLAHARRRHRRRGAPTSWSPSPAAPLWRPHWRA
jgi:hypothetical protein